MRLERAGAPATRDYAGHEGGVYTLLNIAKFLKTDACRKNLP